MDFISLKAMPATNSFVGQGGALKATRKNWNPCFIKTKPCRMFQWVSIVLKEKIWQIKCSKNCGQGEVSAL